MQDNQTRGGLPLPIKPKSNNQSLYIMKKNYTYLGTTKANHTTIISLGMQFGLQHIRKMSIGEAIAKRANEGDERCISACEEHPELFGVESI